MAIDIRAYLAPTLVLLAFDWNAGKSNPDFLGFAVKRSPALGQKTEALAKRKAVALAGLFGNPRIACSRGACLFSMGISPTLLEDTERNFAVHGLVTLS